MKIKNVLIVGAGTMGQQIGLQCAMNGFSTTMYDVNEASLANCRSAQQELVTSWRKANPDATDEEVAQGLQRLSYISDLEAAARAADLVNESAPEVMEIKHEIYRQLSRFCSKDTILTTNTSTLLPSQIVPAVEHPERFLCLHFLNGIEGIWAAPLGEVMKHAGTSEEAMEHTLEFTRQIAMRPIRIDREQPGYVINTLLVPWVAAATALVANGVASYQDVDRTWMIATHMKHGPIAILDNIGLQTWLNVCNLLADGNPGNPQYRRNAEFIKTEYVDKGRLGVQSGQGFYDYPSPEFAGADFLG